MDSSNTIKEFFENQGGIKMELNTISGLAIAGVKMCIRDRMRFIRLSGISIIPRFSRIS